VIARHGIAELARGDGGGAALHHDEPAGIVGEARGFVERRAAASASAQVAMTVSPAPVTSVTSSDRRSECDGRLLGWNSAMPRLPRVTSTLPCAYGAAAPAGALEHVEVVVDRDAEHCSTSDSFGVQIVSPR
jgi:hypothetical protein